jgi:hypothetical protein
VDIWQWSKPGQQVPTAAQAAQVLLLLVNQEVLRLHEAPKQQTYSSASAERMTHAHPWADACILALIHILQHLPHMLLPLQHAAPQEGLQLQLVHVCEVIGHGCSGGCGVCTVSTVQLCTFGRWRAAASGNGTDVLWHTKTENVKLSVNQPS